MTEEHRKARARDADPVDEREKQALEEIMALGLESLGWSPAMVAAFIACERLHGVLRPSAPGWLVRSSGETWPQALQNLKDSDWIIFGGLSG